MFICKIFAWNLVLKKLSCALAFIAGWNMFSCSPKVDKVDVLMNIAQPVMELGFAEFSAGPILL